MARKAKVYKAKTVKASKNGHMMPAKKMMMPKMSKMR